MHKIEKKLIAYAFVLAAVLGLAVPVRAAKVAEIKGTVYVKVPDSEWFPCTPGLGIKEKMTLRTGKHGRARITFAGKSSLILLPSTEVYVDSNLDKKPFKPDSVHLVLDNGTVIVKNSGSEGKYKFRVSTRTAAITAPKSVFTVRADKDRLTVLASVEGKVCARARDKTVCVNSMQSTRVKKKEPPTAPKAPDKAMLDLWEHEKLLPGAQSNGALKLNVLKPEDGAYATSPQIKVVGKATPGAEVEVNGKPATLRSSGSFTHEIGLAEGENKIVVTARKGKNKQSVTLIVILDTSPPLLSVSQPPDSFDPSMFGTCDNRKCNIQIFGITEPGVTLIINNLNVSQYVEDDGSFFITDFPLKLSESTLVVEAEDRVGQRTTEILTVTAPQDSDGDTTPDFQDSCPFDPLCH